MRRPLLLAFLVALGAAAPTRAETVTLWGCHGPGGAGLPLDYTASSLPEVAITAPGDGCGAPGGSIRIAFTRPDPLDGQHASLRFPVPSGVTLDGVSLGRRALGPGYWAQTSSTPLETLAGPGTLDGVFSAAAGGQWIEVGLRCDTADERCDAADARVDLRHAALLVRDETAPTFAVSGVPALASATITVAVDARDSGIGVAAVSATLGGRSVATERAGIARCSELSPADATTDLPLAEDCPAADRFVLAIDTRAVADGAQRLELAVADGAGNTTVRGYDVRVFNTPPSGGPGSPPSPPQGGVAIAPPPPPVALSGVIRVRKRYKVARDGVFSVDARCPAAASSTCALTLKLTAKLPGRKRATTIATARSTAKPGKRAKINLRLSSSARAALRKRRTLSAQLTLEGAAPLSVTLAR